MNLCYSKRANEEVTAFSGIMQQQNRQLSQGFHFNFWEAFPLQCMWRMRELLPSNRND